MQPSTPLTDTLANISPIAIVIVVTVLTLIRITLAKFKDSWARIVSETCDTINFVLILAFLLIRPFVAQAFYIPSESMEYTLLTKDRLIVDKFSYRLHEPQRHDVVVFDAPPEATDGIIGQDYIKRLIGKENDTIQVKAAKLVVDGEVIDPQTLGYRNAHDYVRDRMGISDEVSVKFFKDRLLVGGKDWVMKDQLAQSLGHPGGKIEIVPGETILNGKVQEEPYTREDPDYNLPEDTEAAPIRIEPGKLYMLGDNRNMSKDSHIWGQLDRHRVVGKAVVVFWPPARAGRIK